MIMATSKYKNLLSAFCLLAVLGRLQFVCGVVILHPAPGAIHVVSEEQPQNPRIEEPSNHHRVSTPSAPPGITLRSRAFGRTRTGKDNRIDRSKANQENVNKLKVTMNNRVQEQRNQYQTLRNDDADRRAKQLPSSGNRLKKAPKGLQIYTDNKDRTKKHDKTEKVDKPEFDPEDPPKKDHKIPQKIGWFVDAVMTVEELAAAFFLPTSYEAAIESAKCDRTQRVPELVLRADLITEEPVKIKSFIEVHDAGVFKGVALVRSEVWGSKLSSRIASSDSGYIIWYRFAPNGRFALRWKHCFETENVCMAPSGVSCSEFPEYYKERCKTGAWDDRYIGSVTYQFSRPKAIVRRQVDVKGVCVVNSWAPTTLNGVRPAGTIDRDPSATMDTAIQGKIRDTVEEALSLKSSPGLVILALQTAMRDEYYTSHSAFKDENLGWHPGVLREYTLGVPA